MKSNILTKNKWRYIFIIGFLLINLNSRGQNPDSRTVSPWSQNLDLNFYLYKNDFFTVPVYEVNKDHLHLEAHYNYEARYTFSAWYGYNLKGGNDLRYFITPMAGIVFGGVNGLAPGLELTLTYKKFIFISDSEYVFDLEQQSDDYFYVWTELSYLPKDWLEFGISYQRTRLRDVKIEFQGGAFVGGTYKWIQLTGYVYFGQDDPFGLLTLTINYPDN